MRGGILVVVLLAACGGKKAEDSGNKAACVRVEPPPGWRTLPSDLVVKEEAGWRKWYGGPSPGHHFAPDPATYLSDRGVLVRIACFRAETTIPGGQLLAWDDVVVRSFDDLAAHNHNWLETHPRRAAREIRKLALADGTSLVFTETRLSPPMIGEDEDAISAFGHDISSDAWHIHISIGARARDYSYDEVAALFATASIAE